MASEPRGEKRRRKETESRMDKISLQTGQRVDRIIHFVHLVGFYPGDLVNTVTGACKRVPMIHLSKN